MDAELTVDALTIAARAETGHNSEASLRLVRLPALMDISAGARDVMVALIDGPIARNHPDIANDNIRVLNESSDECDKPESAACVHGTNVAGVLHGRRECSVPGICPGCRLLVRPIFSENAAVKENDGVPSATAEELAAALREVIEAGARVINLSVGLAGASSLHGVPTLDQALEHAARRGVLVIAAAGNQGMLGGSAITRHPWVIPVVGCDQYGQILARSNLGASIGRHGLAAPGHNITSLAATGGHAQFSGSSAAVPFVSGTVALLWSVFPRASAIQLRLAVMGSATCRRSVTPPLLDAWAAHRALVSTNIGVHVR